jgi:hypothetical protein
MLLDSYQSWWVLAASLKECPDEEILGMRVMAEILQVVSAIRPSASLFLGIPVKVNIDSGRKPNGVPE